MKSGVFPGAYLSDQFRGDEASETSSLKTLASAHPPVNPELTCEDGVAEEVFAKILDRIEQGLARVA